MDKMKSIAHLDPILIGKNMTFQKCIISSFYSIECQNYIEYLKKKIICKYFPRYNLRKFHWIIS